MILVVYPRPWEVSSAIKRFFFFQTVFGLRDVSSFDGEGPRKKSGAPLYRGRQASEKGKVEGGKVTIMLPRHVLKVSKLRRTIQARAQQTITVLRLRC